MQATRLLQHNNPPQNQSQTSQVQCLQVLKSNKGTQLLLINNTHSHLQKMKNTPFNAFKLPYNTMQATYLF